MSNTKQLRLAIQRVLPITYADAGAIDLASDLDKAKLALALLGRIDLGHASIDARLSLRRMIEILENRECK